MYIIVAISVTLRNAQSHLTILLAFQMNFSHSCAAVDIDSHTAVSLR